MPGKLPRVQIEQEKSRCPPPYVIAQFLQVIPHKRDSAYCQTLFSPSLYHQCLNQEKRNMSMVDAVETTNTIAVLNSCHSNKIEHSRELSIPQPLSMGDNNLTHEAQINRSIPEHLFLTLELYGLETLIKCLS